MTDRERWTVYPLLFLALGVAMHDKVFKFTDIARVQCESLLCKTLVVTDEQGRQQVVLTSNRGGGIVQSENMLCQTLVVTDETGNQKVIVSSDSGGGIVQAPGNTGHPNVLLGHAQRLSGLLFVDGEGRVLRGSVAIPAQQTEQEAPTDPDDTAPDEAAPEEAAPDEAAPPKEPQ